MTETATTESLDELFLFMKTLRPPTDENAVAFLRRYDAMMNQVTVPIPEPEIVTLGLREGWSLRLAVWSSSARPNGPVVIHLHGGGWSHGDHLSHRGLAAELVAAGFLTVTVDYRRASKFPFPAAYDDCVSALEWCVENIGGFGGDPERIAMIGDSAGANLAAAVACTPDAAPVRALGLLYGTYEFHDSMVQLGRTPDQQGYVPVDRFEALRGDTRLSPIHGAARFPVTYLAAGSDDPYLPQTQQLQASLVDFGIRNECHVMPGLPHGYIQLPTHPDYPAALTSLTSFLDRELAGPVLDER